MSNSKTILIAPIDWGLGHATRCIPIIRNLLKERFKVIIASSGEALLLLQKEFPNLKYLELPSYRIEYPKNGIFFKYAMIRKLKSFYEIKKKENALIADFISRQKIDGIISDGRLGVRHTEIPSVFITHQIQVKTGKTTYLSTKLHQLIINKFDECWIPDYAHNSKNLSGDLGHPDSIPFPIKYIGPLSRMKKKKSSVSIDILALLSGPEPQRTQLEVLLIEELKKSSKENIIIVGGKIEKEQIWSREKNLKIVNFVLSEELETLINRSELIIARSGYTTIMDLVKLEKKAFFIPTPGQYEQEYLAKRMKKIKMAPSISQKEFDFKILKYADSYIGMTQFSEKKVNFQNLFEIFQ